MRSRPSGMHELARVRPPKVKKCRDHIKSVKIEKVSLGFAFGFGCVWRGFWMELCVCFDDDESGDSNAAMIRSGERNVAAETIQSEAMRRRRQTSSSTSDQNGAADDEDEWNEDVQHSNVRSPLHITYYLIICYY
ncbi:unnamed protein product [Anisakis simplex]|uniref:Uncharacterized protein n=1 Tax=Anisakis simplex TaxID=6269 RepID=A0A0M3JF16_ANISI|nr:unnamed protein product [Anisakis simplex]